MGGLGLKMIDRRSDLVFVVPKISLLTACE